MKFDSSVLECSECRPSFSANFLAHSTRAPSTSLLRVSMATLHARISSWASFNWESFHVVGTILSVRAGVPFHLGKWYGIIYGVTWAQLECIVLFLFTLMFTSCFWVTVFRAACNTAAHTSVHSLSLPTYVNPKISPIWHTASHWPCVGREYLVSLLQNTQICQESLRWQAQRWRHNDVKIEISVF